MSTELKNERPDKHFWLFFDNQNLGRFKHVWSTFNVHICLWFLIFFCKVVFKITKMWYDIVTVSFPSFLSLNLFLFQELQFSIYFGLDILKLNLTISIGSIVYMLLKYSLSLLATPSYFVGNAYLPLVRKDWGTRSTSQLGTAGNCVL